MATAVSLSTLAGRAAIRTRPGSASATRADGGIAARRRERYRKCFSSHVTLVAFLLATALLSTLCLAGCGTQTAHPSVSPEPRGTSASSAPSGDADSLMAQAKALAKKTNNLGMELWEGQMFEVVLAPDAAAAKPQLAKARALVDEMRANEESIVALLEQVVRLDASEELTTYAGQQKEIAELQLLGFERQEDLLEEIELTYQEKGKISEADLEKLFVALEPSDPDDPLMHVEEKGHASIEYFKQSGLPEKYYINNGLGEAYDTLAGPSEEEGWENPFPVSDGIELLVADPTDDGGWKEQGSFTPPIADAMRDERSLLENDGWAVDVTSSGATRGVMTARKGGYEVTFVFKQAESDESGTLVVRLNHP